MEGIVSSLGSFRKFSFLVGVYLRHSATLTFRQYTGLIKDKLGCSYKIKQNENILEDADTISYIITTEFSLKESLK